MISTIQRTLTETPLLAIFIVFWAGAIASLGSCTLVRIPVFFGYVVGASNSKNKSILLTALFSLGLIVSYTLFGVFLGIISNLAGKLVEISRYIFMGLGVLLFLSGLFISGLITCFNLHSNRHINNRFKSTSFLGTFLFGITFAFLEMPACPCCSSVLFVIAGIVAIKGSFLYSVIIFFSFAVGQSFPILLIGSSMNLVKYLTSRLTRFEEYIRLIAGDILIVFSMYFFIIA
ncbi:MAG: cytochrome c biogenesis protein CcdA [bacterium]|nr:cytochrome c biogenesis protein CcdA [bacterium]